jgi:hypothetical protein
MEDFAESVAFYILHADSMRASVPEKYALLKKRVFDGQEYLLEKSESDLLASLEALGTPRGLLFKKCMGSVTAIHPLNESQSYYTRTVQQTERDRVTTIVLKSVSRPNDCLKETARDLNES